MQSSGLWLQHTSSAIVGISLQLSQVHQLGFSGASGDGRGAGAWSGEVSGL